LTKVRLWCDQVHRRRRSRGLGDKPARTGGIVPNPSEPHDSHFYDGAGSNKHGVHVGLLCGGVTDSILQVFENRHTEPLRWYQLQFTIIDSSYPRLDPTTVRHTSQTARRSSTLKMEMTLTERMFHVSESNGSCSGDERARVEAQTYRFHENCLVWSSASCSRLQRAGKSDKFG
jgi:hypothetical protein